MKILYPSTQYKRDIKRYRKQPKKMAKLNEVFRMLENEEPLPPELKAHFLKGELKGCMECHVENDFLLIWFDEESEVIELLRLGTHSELFNNK